MSVLVIHPGRQHSHRLALALQSAGLLAGYWTGIPTALSKHPERLQKIFRAFVKYDGVSIPSELVTFWPWASVLQKLVNKTCPKRFAVDYGHRCDGLFDSWAANKLELVGKVSAVVAYENSAERTFKYAKKQGILCVLDAASFHPETQDEWCEYPESPRAHRRIRTRKNTEIALADCILTVSSLARESYIRAGVDGSKVLAIPLGADLSRFGGLGVKSRALGPIRFLFAGYASTRKGIDLLVNALKRLVGEAVSFEMVIVGDFDPSYAIDLASVGAVMLGRLSQDKLAIEMQTADCFVLPSRHDSFGMVVVEAMAAGLPAIVSNRVGAKEALSEGESGWILPALDADTLFDRLLWCTKNMDTVRAMRGYAKRDASRYSWAIYDERVIELFSRLVLTDLNHQGNHV